MSMSLFTLCQPCVYRLQKTKRAKQRLNLQPDETTGPREALAAGTWGPSHLKQRVVLSFFFHWSGGRKLCEILQSKIVLEPKKCLEPHDFHMWVWWIFNWPVSQQRLFVFKVEFSISEGVPASKVFTTWGAHSDGKLQVGLRASTEGSVRHGPKPPLGTRWGDWKPQRLRGITLDCSVWAGRGSYACLSTSLSIWIWFFQGKTSRDPHKSFVLLNQQRISQPTLEPFTISVRKWFLERT